MQVRYKVLPEPKDSGTNRVHWLISIVEAMRYAGPCDNILRVKRDRKQAWMTYIVELNKTKSYAQLQGQGRQIRITSFQLEDTDPNSILIPKGVMRNSRIFEMDAPGLKLAVDFLLYELQRESVYSRGDNQRIQLSTHPDLSHSPPVFFGGVVKKVVLDGLSYVNTDGEEIRGASVFVADRQREVVIRVETIPLSFHPKYYRAESRAIASTSTGERHPRVYAFSMEKLQTHYSLN